MSNYQGDSKDQLIMRLKQELSDYQVNQNEFERA